MPGATYLLCGTAQKEHNGVVRLRLPVALPGRRQAAVTLMPSISTMSSRRQI